MMPLHDANDTANCHHPLQSTKAEAAEPEQDAVETPKKRGRPARVCHITVLLLLIPWFMI
jgi:hypothetical protein